MKIGILVIATNKYLFHAKNLFDSVIFHAESEIDITFYVFTDDETLGKEMFQNINGVNAEIIEIEPLSWPEATLFRYSIVTEHSKRFTNQDILIYMDADMLIKRKIFGNIIDICNKSEMALVRHPGYWRGSTIKEVTKFYQERPKILVKDFFRQIILGGLGSWENRKLSLAFVPRNKRKKYFCGGIWFGRSKHFLGLCKVLAKRVDEDYKNDFIAKWHDESHLNWWAVSGCFQELDPRWCYAYELLPRTKEEPFILAVEKKDHEKTR